MKIFKESKKLVLVLLTTLIFIPSTFASGEDFEISSIFGGMFGKSCTNNMYTEMEYCCKRVFWISYSCGWEDGY